MSEPKAEIMTNSELNVLGNMEIKSEDLVAVAVARRERSLEQRLSEAERNFLRLQAKTEKLSKQFDKELITLVEAEFSVRVATLKTTLAEFGAKVKVRLYPIFNVENKTIEVSLKVESEGGRCGDANFTLPSQTVAASETVISTYEANLQVREEANKVINERIELKKALGNMGTTERRARAALAEASLASSERGRALLSAMTEIPDLLTVSALDIIDVTE